MVGGLGPILARIGWRERVGATLSDIIAASKGKLFIFLCTQPQTTSPDSIPVLLGGLWLSVKEKLFISPYRQATEQPIVQFPCTLPAAPAAQEVVAEQGVSD